MSSTKADILRISDAEESQIKRQIAADPDDSEITDDDLAAAKPFSEALPELFQSIQRARGRPVQDQTKTPITIRLDPDIVEHYKATGKGWQSRMNDDLRKAAGL